MREKQAEMIDNLQKKLTESKGDTNTLRRGSPQRFVRPLTFISFHIHIPVYFIFIFKNVV